ncbi:MAG: GIY-YIG nuclease family protein [Candidatus Vogelbacteria bacterium]|nr:GIY-YIG nuclease family protein [Candidatus Vogelbacteria bacterium]
MSWYVYIARARTGCYYTGITNNPELRIVKHNSGKGSQMAIQQGPFELVYTSPELPDKSSARKREAQLKKWTREKKEKLISGKWL